MPIYKRCIRCGKRIPSGSTCECFRLAESDRYKQYDRQRRNPKSKSFYSSNEWIKARDAALQADDGIDVYVFMTTGRIVAADTVHHIIPLRDDWGRRLNVGNLMSLHHDTHSMIEQEYKKDKQGMERRLSRMLNEYRKSAGQQDPGGREKVSEDTP